MLPCCIETDRIDPGEIALLAPLLKSTSYCRIDQGKAQIWEVREKSRNLSIERNSSNFTLNISMRNNVQLDFP